MFKNTIKFLSFLLLMILFVTTDFALFRFFLLTNYINFIFFGIIVLLQGFILAKIAGYFSRSKSKESELKSRKISIQKNIEEQEEYLFIPLKIKRITYKKLEEIGKITKTNMTPAETNESIINELYSSLYPELKKKAGEII